MGLVLSWAGQAAVLFRRQIAVDASWRDPSRTAFERCTLFKTVVPAFGMVRDQER